MRGTPSIIKRFLESPPTGEIVYVWGAWLPVHTRNQGIVWVNAPGGLACAHINECEGFSQDQPSTPCS